MTTSAQARESAPLGFGSLLSLGLNGIVGVGIFFAPAQVAKLADGAIGSWLYLVTLAALAPVALAYALLGSRFRRDGGPFVWAEAAFGLRVAAAVGWVAYVSAVFSTAAVVSGLATHLGPELGFASVPARRGFGLVCVVVLAGLNLSGLRLSARIWSTVTVLKLIPLIGLLALALMGAGTSTPFQPRHEVGAISIGRAVLVIVFALQGFEIVAVPAGRIRGGGRSIGFATLLSVAGVAVLYSAIHEVCRRHVPGLASSGAPLVAAGEALGGARWAAVMRVATNLSALGIAFGMFAMTPRYLAVLKQLWPWVGGGEVRGVPRRCVLITAAIVSLMVVLGDLTALFVLSSVAVLTQYTVSVLALARLAWRRERGLRRWMAGIAPPAVVSVVLIGSEATVAELATLLGVLGTGVVLLALRGRFSAVLRR